MCIITVNSIHTKLIVSDMTVVIVKICVRVRDMNFSVVMSFSISSPNSVEEYNNINEECKNE